MATNNNHSSNGFSKKITNHNGAISNNAGNEGEEIELRYLMYLLWGHKWIIAGIIAACVFLAGLAAILKTPIYRSEGSLMIKKSQNQYSYAGSDLQNLITSSYGIGLGNSIADELQMLKSRRLSREVADTLMKDPLMRNGRQYPVLFNSYPGDSTMAQEDTVAQRLRKSLSFQQVDQESNLITVAYKSPSPAEAADIVNQTITSYSYLSTQQNRKSANSAVEFLGNEKKRIENELHNAEQNLQQYMTKSQLVQVDAQTESLINRTADLEQRRQEARTKLVAANSGIKQYKQQLDNIKPGLADQYANAIGPNMSRLQYQLAELQTKKMKMLSQNPDLKDSANPPQELQNIDRQIKDYRDQIRTMTQSLINKGDQYLTFLGSAGGNAAEEVSQLQQKLIQLKVEQQQYQSQVDVLTTEISKLNGKFDDLPENMTNLARLKRNVKINEELYLTVSKQYAEMSLWKQTQFGEGQLVDRGYVPDAPIEPNTKLYLLIGFVLGGILGVGYVFTKEAFNNRIDGIQKLKQFDAPMLAVIPDIQHYVDEEHKGRKSIEANGQQVSTRLVGLLNTVSPVAESFRRLESNILHSNPDNRLNSLLVTSTTQGEGKTTIAANLGVIMAEADQKVIVVDTDLRRSNLHRMFGLERAPGIVDVLFENTLLDEAIRPTNIPNLNVLTAGQRPPNPSAITKSASFRELIKKLELQYDRVIVDSSPFGIITDSSSLIDQMDGVLVVCHFNKTKTGELDHTLHQLERVDAGMTGTVLNGFDADHSSDYYYGQSYYREFYGKYNDYIEKDEEAVK